MVSKYQNMNSYGTTTCGIIIDDEKKNFRYYPVQAMEVSYGKRVSKKRIKELLAECIDKGYSELPVEWGGRTFYGSGRNQEDIEEVQGKMSEKEFHDYDSLYKIIIHDKEYVIEDAYCISEAIDWATTQHYEECKEEVYNDDPEIVVVDLLENETYRWDEEFEEFVLSDDNEILKEEILSEKDTIDDKIQKASERVSKDSKPSQEKKNEMELDK